MTTALVTGANRGLGLQTVRELAAAGWTVHLGSRDLTAGKEAAAGLPGDVRPLEIDVTSEESVAAAAAAVPELDVLVNNAGITGPWLQPEDTRPADFLPVFGVNLLGPVRVTHAFLPALRRSAHPVIVNVSSGIGSFAVMTDPARMESSMHGLVYSSSKAALNMLTVQYAKALPAFRVNAVDPGYTATGMNGFQGTQTVEEGARTIVELARVAPDGPTGGLFADRGRLDW
jgi:NAD(P)-dependent dehydrogenase (short-subunit alcohol dehydrogenase family)